MKVGSIRIAEPDKVSATMEITMTIGEWETLRHQLAVSDGCSIVSMKFVEAIRNLVWDIKRVVILDAGEAE